MTATIVAFEGQRIDLPAGARRRGAVERLLRISVQDRAAFTLRGSAVYATGYVGAVDVGAVRVEVLPKVSGVDSIEEGREVLFRLLRWAGADARVAWLRGGAGARSADLLQVVERGAAADLLRRLEMGAPRRYREVAERSQVLRGRINFSAYAAQRPSEAHLLPIRHNPLVADNDLGRLLKALAMYLRDRATSFATKRDLDRSIDILGAVQSHPLTTSLVAKVRLGRFEEEWQALVDLASLLVGGKTPNPTVIGPTRQATLLFPLERLFESLLRRTLSDVMVRPIECVRSPGVHRLLSTAAGADALSIRPDLLFQAEHDGSMVPGDAKWKRLDDAPPRHGVTPADIYQLLCYMRRFAASCGVLFYPLADWMAKDWQVSFDAAPDHATIAVLGVDVRGLADKEVGPRRRAAEELAERVQRVLSAPRGT